MIARGSEFLAHVIIESGIDRWLKRRHVRSCYTGWAALLKKPSDPALLMFLGDGDEACWGASRVASLS